MYNSGGKMHNKSLENTFKLLGLLVQNSECTIEQLARAMQKDYTTSLRLLKRLEKARLVKLSRLEKTSSKGKEKRYYRITLYGLEVYLSYASAKNILPEVVRQAAQAHSDMLLSFKKWDKIAALGCEKLCLRNLELALKVILFSRYEFIPRLSSKITSPEEEDNQRRVLDCAILGITNCTVPIDFFKEGLSKEGLWEDMLKLLHLIEKDYELRQLRDWYFFTRETDAKDTLRSIEEWREFFVQLPK